MPHDIQDGSAWWSAREAIDVAKAKQERRNPTVRTWYTRAICEHVGRFPDEQTAYAYLIARDYIVGKMRREHAGDAARVLVGQTQSELAKELGITQGTVSSAMRKSGPSIVIEGVDQIRSRWGDVMLLSGLLAALAVTDLLRPSDAAPTQATPRAVVVRRDGDGRDAGLGSRAVAVDRAGRSGRRRALVVVDAGAAQQPVGAGRARASSSC